MAPNGSQTHPLSFVRLEMGAYRWLFQQYLTLKNLGFNRKKMCYLDQITENAWIWYCCFDVFVNVDWPSSGSKRFSNTSSFVCSLTNGGLPLTFSTIFNFEKSWFLVVKIWYFDSKSSKSVPFRHKIALNVQKRVLRTILLLENIMGTKLKIQKKSSNFRFLYPRVHWKFHVFKN